MTPNIHPPVLSNAQSALSNKDIPRISSTMIETTRQRGDLLETVRPHWRRVTESEQRIAWLKKMIGKRQ